MVCYAPFVQTVLAKSVRALQYDLHLRVHAHLAFSVDVMLAPERQPVLFVCAALQALLQRPQQSQQRLQLSLSLTSMNEQLA
jgi:hypothetical protein